MASKTTYLLVTVLATAVLSAVVPGRAGQQEREQKQQDREKGADSVRQASPLRFEHTEWDFGEIDGDGGEVSHVFEFENTGEEPIAIDRVVASCGCTTSEYPRRVIAPREKASIKVSFDPEGYRGKFSKEIAVVCGGNKYSNFLTIKGICIQ